MAVPKKKTSKSRRDQRRSHLALKPTNYVKCKNCGSDRLPHHICKSCGHYNMRQVFSKPAGEEVSDSADAQ
ncbi:MAG: 50S ribosomal protein L32 [Holosporales bacterium]|jgi:large subunit ribosomal protein L32|nr:50S ribosomal protein L32 [Holosporales bacterium]